MTRHVERCPTCGESRIVCDTCGTKTLHYERWVNRGLWAGWVLDFYCPSCDPTFKERCMAMESNRAVGREN